MTDLGRFLFRTTTILYIIETLSRLDSIRLGLTQLSETWNITTKIQPSPLSIPFLSCPIYISASPSFFLSPLLP